VKTRLRDRDDTLYTRYYNSDFGLCVCVCVCGSVGVCKVDLAALRGDKKEDKETRNSGEQTKAQGGRQSSEHGTFMPLQKCSPRFKQGQKAYVLASERRSPKKKHARVWKNHFTRWKCCAWAASALHYVTAFGCTLEDLPTLTCTIPTIRQHNNSNMTTRRIVNNEKSTLDYDGKGAPEPSNTSPAVPS